ncbi:baseplate J/gp47 family protein [Clostridiaceae bacterium M8S5]|nr:baseplate J/gp47 family protein [Clostridiaceae bacterium M8S5]
MDRYKDQTFDNIMERMLAKIPDSIDKREGSIIYDALSPACSELSQLYIELNTVLELAFVDTSNSTWLDKRCAEQGIARKGPIKAQRVGAFDVLVPIESRFSIDGVNYKVIKSIDSISNDKKYILECEEAGTIGNEPIGNLVPINYLADIDRAVLTDILVAGTEKETDESLRARYKQKVNQSPTSGNIFHYMKWAKEIKNVGAVRVIPAWDGANTVKVLLTDNNLRKSRDEIVKNVQNHIDPSVSGLGKGVAPIGCKCTVQSADEKTINITATVNGTNASKVKAVFDNKVQLYFNNLIKEKWQSGESYSVSYPKIGALLLESIVSAGGIDYSNLLINTATGNIQLDNNIPVVGSVVLG